MLKRSLIAALTATAAAALMSGCSLLSEGDTVEDLQLAVGDCISDSVVSDEGSYDVGALPTVECTEPHFGEVYFTEDLADGDYPVGVEETASTLCYDNYEAFAGIAYEESIYYYSYLVPSVDTWAAGDRQIVCMIVGEEGEEFTESLEGVAL